MSYIINNETLALIPERNKSRIIEEDCLYIEKESLNSIVNRSCCHYGSTLEGRQKGTGYILGSSYKPPIILDEDLRLILIPTHSTRNKCCSWVMLNNVLSYHATSNDRTIVEFRCGRKVTINCSFTIFDHQVLRATRLESILRGRNNKKHL